MIKFARKPVKKKPKDIEKMMRWANKEKYIRYGKRILLWQGEQESCERALGYPVEVIQELRNPENGLFPHFSTDTHYEFIGRKGIVALIDYEPSSGVRRFRSALDMTTDTFSNYEGSGIPVRKKY